MILGILRDTESRTRVTCSNCRAFLVEIKPRLFEKQKIITFCKNCKKEVVIKR